MLMARGQSAAGLIGTTIVVADGDGPGGGQTNDNEGYNAATNAWTSLTPDSTERIAPCGGAIGSKLYVAGGVQGGTLNDAFQLSKNKWTTLAALPQTTQYPAFATYKGKLYCIGGWASFGGPINNNVQIYQP